MKFLFLLYLADACHGFTLLPNERSNQSCGPGGALATEGPHKRSVETLEMKIKMTSTMLHSSRSRPSEILLDVSELKTSNVELWLDLRETRIPAQTALGHIATEVWEESKYADRSGGTSLIVDKVLTRQKSDINSYLSDIKYEYETDIGLMVLDQDSIHEVNENGIMLPCGQVMNVQMGKSGISTLNADPMPVLEPVSKGNWVVLDPDEDIDDYSISSLVEVVSNGADAFNAIGAHSDGLSLPMSKGGIGLSCGTQSSVLEMSTLISSLNKRRKYEMTDTGIITQSESSDEYCSTTYAIVMPFDTALWKTSSFLLLQ